MSHFISRLCMIVRVNVVLNQNRTVVDRNSRVLLVLYYYMRNFCNLIGLEQ